MTLRPPHPTVTPAPTEDPSPARLRELLSRVQANFDFLYRRVPQASTAGAWIAPALQNSWENYGSGHTPARYRRGADGQIHLQGLVKKASGAASSVIFTLPAGMRPNEHLLLLGSSDTSAAGVDRVDIRSGGEVQFFGSASEVGFLSLSLISFYPN